MSDLNELARLKAELIAEWGRHRIDQGPTLGGHAEAVLQTLPPEPLPIGGLTVGHSRDESTGEILIEIRVTAGGGPNLARARRVKRYAELQGFRTRLMRFLQHPSIPRHPQLEKEPLVFGGTRRPLHLGASVAHEQGDAGTLGAFVELAGGRTGVISCTHVLARPRRGRAKHGDFIQQPGSPELVTGENRIGELTRQFAPFIGSRSDNLDAAVACLYADVEAHGNVIPNVPCVPEALRGRPVGTPLPQENIPLGKRVFKVGRTTGFSRGVISMADVVNFRPNLGAEGSFTFGTVVQISPLDRDVDFTRGGDSGSLVMTEEGLHPVGLHFCSVPVGPLPSEDDAPLEMSGWLSYLMPWWRISDELGVRLKR